MMQKLLSSVFFTFFSLSLVAQASTLNCHLDEKNKHSESHPLYFSGKLELSKNQKNLVVTDSVGKYENKVFAVDTITKDDGVLVVSGSIDIRVVEGKTPIDHIMPEVQSFVLKAHTLPSTWNSKGEPEEYFPALMTMQASYFDEKMGFQVESQLPTYMRCEVKGFEHELQK